MTTMFHKNQNQTTEDAPFVSHTACIKHRLSIYFFQEIIPFYKKFHIFWNLKMSISVECHQLRYFAIWIKGIIGLGLETWTALLDLNQLYDILDLDLKNTWTTLLESSWFHNMLDLDYLTGFGLILWYIGLGLEKY